jgi:hypothetical protein
MDILPFARERMHRVEYADRYRYPSTWRLLVPLDLLFSIADNIDLLLLHRVPLLAVYAWRINAVTVQELLLI